LTKRSVCGSLRKKSMSALTSPSMESGANPERES